jgi:hypothetical protein
MRRLTVHIETSAIKGDTAYSWYKVERKMLGLELRGKARDFRVGDVIGLRPSSSGKETRMVVRGSLNVVMSPTKSQVNYILTHVKPLIGGPIDNEKVGHIKEVKVGVKDRRINEELENIFHVLKTGADITDLKIKDKRLYFKYNGRNYGVVSDPS